MTTTITRAVRAAVAAEMADGVGVTALDLAQALGMGSRRASAWLARLAGAGEIRRAGRQTVALEDRLGRPTTRHLTVYLPTAASVEDTPCATR